MQWEIDGEEALRASPDAPAGSPAARSDTPQSATETSLRQQAEFLRGLVHACPDWIVTLDAQGRIVTTNDRACNLLDFATNAEAAAHLIGTEWATLWRGEEQGAARAAVARAATLARTSHGVPGANGVSGATGAGLAADTVRFYGFMPTQMGVPRWWDVAVSPFSPAPASGPVADRVVCVARDMTRQRASDIEKDRLLIDATNRADQDPLTGLLNHRAFHTRLEREAERARQSGRPMAVVVMDVDNFKLFNDVFGHLQGDLVLVAIARCLEKTCRRGDFAARPGGDEFALILPGADGEEAARFVARLHAAVAEIAFRPGAPSAGGGGKPRVSGAGVALQPGDWEGAEATGFLQLPNTSPEAVTADTVPIRIAAGAAILPQEAHNVREVYRLADQRSLFAKAAYTEGVLPEGPVAKSKHKGGGGVGLSLEAGGRRRGAASPAPVPGMGLPDRMADLLAVALGSDTNQDVSPDISEFAEEARLLDALLTAVDSRDRYTRRHSQDVCALCGPLAQAAVLTPRATARLQVAALLHDVGKVVVADRLLRLPLRFNNEERQAMRQHTLLGGALVQAVLLPEVTPLQALTTARHDGAREIVAVIRAHHERWDAEGYPDGLAGDAIPYLARLLMVADTFSSLTLDRPYRRALTQNAALDALARSAQTGGLDPHLVALFTGILAP